MMQCCGGCIHKKKNILTMQACVKMYIPTLLMRINFDNMKYAKYSGSLMFS